MVDASFIPAIQPPSGTISNLIDPPSVGFRITITNVVCIVLFMVVVAIRLITRVFLNRSFGHDDSLIIFATASFLAIMGVFQWMVSLGLGKHLWDVSLEAYSPGFLRAWLTAAVLYAACMLTMKLSVLMLYRRLFPITNFQIQWWFAFFFVNAYSLSFIFASIFSCSPISAAWNNDIPDQRCINRTALYIAYTVMNSVSTWWILLMPMPIVWSLALKNNQKTLLSCLFALGCLPCVTSIARLVVLVKWLHDGHSDTDITYTLWPIVMWTQLELTVCMVCACGPTIRTFIDRQLSILKSVTSNHSFSWISKSRTNTRSSNSHPTSSTLSKPHFNSDASSGLPTFIEMLQGRGNTKSKTLVTGQGTRDETGSMEHIVDGWEEESEGFKTGEEGKRRILVHTSYQVRTVREDV